MKYLIVIILLSTVVSTHVIFDFNKNSNVKSWIIVDDVVMGGKSSGSFRLSSEGHGVFEGNISLKNYGGFSSVRYRFKKLDIKGSTKIILKVKGDGKKYQFRIKSNSSDYYSYIYSFSTTGKWEEIQIPLKDMYPSFRGRKLNLPNFSNDYIEEIAFLIGNKKQEKFKLLIDKVALK
jgi:NADH dehydrogenase [ubiquinone] 1 alpha subcomplex assembly factor 1